MSRKTSRKAESLRSSAFGFARHIEVHEQRGNAGAVAEAETELDRTLAELELADGVRPVDYVIALLSSLGPTPVDRTRVDALRRQIAARAKRRSRR